MQFKIIRIRYAIRKVIQISLFLLFMLLSDDLIAQENSILSDTIATPKELIADSVQLDDTLMNPSVNIYQPGIRQETFEKANASKEKSKKQKKTDTTHYSPKKAALWATACPGLGQVYNKKYWKLPIVYGLIGTMVYFVVSNGKNLSKFNGYIRNVYDSVPNPSPYDQLQLTEIESLRNTYRRNVQLSAFGTIFAWGLSIVDAAVDAHLKDFDISDNLSMKVKPELNYSNFTYYTGIGVNLNFK